MKIFALTIFCCIFSFSVCEWGHSFPICRTYGNIVKQSTFLDTSNGKAHLIFAIGISTNYYEVKYVNVDKNGLSTNPITIGKNYSCCHPLSITGAHDGKNIYVALPLLRSTTSDIYFVESNTDGLLWSTPLVARSNYLFDDITRISPQIQLVTSRRLFIFYWKNDEIHAVTRPKDTNIWGLERNVHPKGFCFSNKVSSITTSSMPLTTNLDQVFFHIVCQWRKDLEIYPLLGYSHDNGINWDYYRVEKYNFTNDLSASITNTAFNSTIYGCALHEEKNWTIGRLYAYSDLAEWREILFLPKRNLYNQTTRLCKIKGNMSAILFASSPSYRSADDVLMLNVPVNAPWKVQEMQVPPSDLFQFNHEINCIDDEILLTGTAADTGIFGIRYKFN